jgi:MFS family permease
MHIKYFFLYRITGQLLPVYPVYLLLFQQKGLSLSAISGLLILWSLPGLLLEVPSSVLADRWNRRNLMVAGRLLKGLCFVVWSFSSSFTGFAAGFILWGTGGALCSGTEEAWLYDALKAHGREREFDRIWGRSSFYYQMSVGIASVGGSILAAYNMQLTLWLSVAMVALSTIMATLLPEYNFHCQTQTNNAWRSYLTTLKDGISFCWSHSTISILVGFNVTVLVTAGVLDEYDQLIVRSMGVPLAFVGLWGLFRYSMEALGGRVAWKLKRMLGRLGLSRPIPVQLTIALCAGVFLSLVSGFPLLFLLPVYSLYYFLLAADKVLFTDTLQQEIRHQGRATVQSLTAMLETPFGILIYSLFGVTGRFGQLQGAMMAVAVWILAFCILFWILQKGRKGGFTHESTKL